MHQGALLGSGWARGGGSAVVRRACPASGATFNVQVVRGKVNGRCLWNACKALSLGLLLMVLGAAMATIGYYADHLSVAQEVRGNHTVRIKNESRGFHLNNLSYAGPIVMGVGGFIVVAACVMTFEARDNAAKVVPARFKVSGHQAVVSSGGGSYVVHSHGGAHRSAGSQTGGGGGGSGSQRSHHSDRQAITQSFVQFSRELASSLEANRKQSPALTPTKELQQRRLSRSPSAPNLARLERCGSNESRASPSSFLPSSSSRNDKVSPRTNRRNFAACALLNPGGLLHRFALSVDETHAQPYRLSNESLHGSGSQGSMAMDLHMEAVTLRVRDQTRRSRLTRQRPVEEDDGGRADEEARRTSHSCSPRMGAHHSRNASITPSCTGGSAHHLPSHHQLNHHMPHPHRRSSNASDCTHRTRHRRRGAECPHTRGRLERAVSSDSRLTGAIPKCYHHHAAPIQPQHHHV